MNQEFKKSVKGTETRYVLETASSGATSSGSVASVAGSVGKVQKRGNILAQEAGKEKEAPKPRNFVAKNAKMGGAGKMQDKSKTIPRKEKHKKPVAEGFNGEYDDEAGMAHSNLLTTARAVMGLLKTIKDRDNLPEWGQEKIAKAEMMLVSVWDYLQSQKEMGNDPQVAEGDRTMSRAAKGHEKYGKAGMAALAKAGRDGAGEETLDKIRDKHDKYNEGVAEGSEFGAYYYEKVAQEIFNQRQDISSEDEVLNQAWKIVSAEQGNKSARYMFNYDEDFPSDLLGAYRYLQDLQKQKQGVAEVAGPEKCWPGHRKVGTKPGTGKNAGKRVNDCEKIGEGAVKDLMYDLKHMSDEEFTAQYKMSKADARKQSSSVAEVAPPGWEKTVKAMKKHDEIDNPFALAWHMKNKGYKSHKKESADPYFESLASKLDQIKKK